jgi:hypothetical protein
MVEVLGIEPRSETARRTVYTGLCTTLVHHVALHYRLVESCTKSPLVTPVHTAGDQRPMWRTGGLVRPPSRDLALRLWVAGEI